MVDSNKDIIIQQQKKNTFWLKRACEKKYYEE